MDSKNGKWDLKQVVLGSIVNQHGILLFMNTHSRNASDKSVILKSIKSLKSDGFYTTEEVFTFLDKEDYEISCRGSMQ